MACSSWKKLEKRLVASQDSKNPIVMMMDSGARSNISNFSACWGMRVVWCAPDPPEAAHENVRETR